MTARPLTPDEYGALLRGDAAYTRRPVRTAPGDGDRVYDRTPAYDEVTAPRLAAPRIPYPDDLSCFSCGAPPSGNLTCPKCGDETCHEMTGADFAADMGAVLALDGLDAPFRAMIERLRDEYA